MITIDEATTFARSMPEAVEQPHFEKNSFRIRKKIFATLDTDNAFLIVKFSASDQDLLCDEEKKIIYPVPGGWGRQGWTRIELKKVGKKLFREAVRISYNHVAPKSLRLEL